MEITKLKEGKKVAYAMRTRAGTTSGQGKVVQVYVTRRNSTKVVLHDRVRNASVTVYPSQISAIPRKPAAV